MSYEPLSGPAALPNAMMSCSWARVLVNAVTGRRSDSRSSMKF
jgi:hypothetical protein